MAYELIRSESVTENIQRIWAEELTAAIHILENLGNEPDKAVHEVRKGIKKIRAIVRLVRQPLGKDRFKQENIRYRDIGHMLSHIREAAVMIKTVEKLRKSDRKAMPRTACLHLRKQLLAKQKEASEGFFKNKEAITAVLLALKEAKQNQPDISIARNSFDKLSTSIQLVYTRGSKTYENASKQPSIDSFHEFRKEVKTLWYHTRLLTPVWQGVLESYAVQLGILSELLGDDHDMGMLYEEIASGRLTFGRKATADTLLKLIENYRNTLQQQVHPLAKRIYAEKPKDFITRIELYWKIWRNEESIIQPV
jgi:CHAD domain-containing protein